MVTSIIKALKNSYIFLFFISFVVFSCIEKIELPIPDKEKGFMVIQGKLSIAKKGFIEVFLSKSYSFTGATAGQVDVLNAEVTLYDNNGNNIKLEGGSLDGYYRSSFDLLSTNLNINTGAKYQLKVNTLDNKEYVSSFENIPELPKADYLSISKKDKETISPNGSINTKKFIGLSITTPLKAAPSTTNSRLSWNVKSTYKLTDTPNNCVWSSIQVIPVKKTCYVNSLENISENLFFDGSQVGIEHLDNYFLYDQVITPKFAEGLYFHVIQQSLNIGAFEFLKKTQQLLERSGSMFDPLPGLLKSNINNIKDEQEIVYGYFYATREDTLRVYVSPEWAGDPIWNCPANVPDGLSAHNQCCDCLLAPGSITTKPMYWQF